MSPGPSDRGLVVFTKPAVPGRVKTRLIGALTPERAAELHGAFLADVLATARGADVEVHVAWALRGDEQIPSEGGWRQEGRDLGERLLDGLSRAAELHRFVAAVGSDHPEMESGQVNAAFRALEEGADVAIRPSDDGGYTLIALRREALGFRLFEGVDWSTGAVLAQTLERATEQGLATRVLPAGRDVDTPEDLEALCERLRASAGGSPATRRLLSGWGFLPGEDRAPEARH